MPDSATDAILVAEAIHAAVVADPSGQRARAEELREGARASGAVEVEVVALRALGHAERLANRNGRALALLAEGLELAGRHGLRRRQGELLLTRVAVHHERGDLDAARQDLAAARELAPTALLRELVFQQAVLRHNEGDLAAAAEGYAEVLAGPAPAMLRAKATNNLAYLESERGQAELALTVLEGHEQLAAEAGPLAAAFLAQTRGRVLAAAGRLAEAMEQLGRARGLYDAAGLPLGELHLESAEALQALHLVPEARRALQAGLAALPEDEVSLMAAEAQLRLAGLCAQAGPVGVARAAALRGGELARAQGRTGWAALAAVLRAALDRQEGQAVDRAALRAAAEDLESCGLRSEGVEARLLLGELAADAGDVPAALEELAAAERLAQGAPVLVRLRGALAAARAAGLRADRPAVLAAAGGGLDDLAGHRSALPTVELRALASAHGRELGEAGLHALLQDPDPVALLGWMERTRAAALAPAQALDEVDGELADLRAAHAEAQAARAGADAVPDALMRRVRAAEEGVRRSSWAGAREVAVPQDVPDAGLVRAALGPAALVELGVLDGAVHAVVLGAGADRVVGLGPVTEVATRVDALQFALRRLARPGAPQVAVASARRAVLTALAGLRHDLLEPLGLEAGQALVVVPAGELQRVTWSPLHDGPVAVAPSAGVWLRTREPHAGTGRISLVGGPGVPGAGAELAALAEVHPGAVVRAESTCADAVDALRGSELAHLACHGRLRTDNPSFSSLQLADGPLTVHELSRRAGTPARVVLAACESGAQVLYPGNEALGFVSALLARGCAGVVASGVLVPDEAALPLMVALHRALARGSTLAEGLHEARQVLDPDDPQQLATRCAFDAYGGG